ncbi:MAG: hypothetical protein K0S39_5437 [Paenibacillus sp.]|nr:hypothetical protein [Paenibacillus sp.]
MLNLRKASMNDLDFLVRIDLKNDGYTPGSDEMTQQQKEEHNRKIKSFLTDEDRGAFVIVDSVLISFALA